MPTAPFMTRGGVEYAVTDHWTRFAEYSHVDLGSTTVPLPTVDVANTPTIGVGQSLDLVRPGANYRFSLSDLTTPASHGDAAGSIGKSL